jgi:hypothetical protein
MLRATVQKAAWFCTVLVFMRVIIGSDLEGDCTILCTRTRPTTAVYVHEELLKCTKSSAYDTHLRIKKLTLS